MKPVNLCIPVLKRYDHLRNMLLSLSDSTVKPKVYIIDNGRDRERLASAVSGCASPEILTPEWPMGLAESWNWFIQNVPEERIICNDDLLFSQRSLEILAITEGDFISGLPGSNACSCFLLRDSCVAKVGLFDEAISPGYAYFEDCDYIERMIQRGIPIVGAWAEVMHIGSQTIAANSDLEMNEHHRRFLIAQGNFVSKWGRLPSVPGPHWPRVGA